jgi:radical SAM protein with 4Fe4S-binding SPASM domain
MSRTADGHQQQRNTRSLTQASTSNTCYFRTGPSGDRRKALLQITERCDLHCAHCFVSSTKRGSDIQLEAIVTDVLPKLRAARVDRLTLTGGEPFAHPDVIAIAAAAVDQGMTVGICTNGTNVTDAQIAKLVEIDDVHVNISFDGFSEETHGRFRGSPKSFTRTVDTARRLSARGLLQGLLSTPNALTSDHDYEALSAFATEIDARYVLMNPLSPFGRGARSAKRLAADDSSMLSILAAASASAGPDLEIVPIRFPNEDKAPLAPCIAGDIVYVFVDGAVAVCPYLVFAARTTRSKYADTEFIVGNIFEDPIAELLDSYRLEDRFDLTGPQPCSTCSLESQCGKGCPAAVVGVGGRLGERDRELCPVSD